MGRRPQGKQKALGTGRGRGRRPQQLRQIRPSVPLTKRKGRLRAGPRVIKGNSPGSRMPAWTVTIKEVTEGIPLAGFPPWYYRSPVRGEWQHVFCRYRRSAEAVVVAAAAAQQKNDPDPVASAAEVVAAMFTASAADSAEPAVAAAAAAAQDQDQPDHVAAAPSRIAAAVTITITSTVCCR